MKHSLALASVLAFTTLGQSAFAASRTSDEAEWRMSMIGPASLSLKESELADSKATDKHVKDFAAFETDEQNALGTILKELGTSVPAMTAKDKATYQKLVDAPKGPEFDKAYIEAQNEGHKTLGSINDDFLDKVGNSPKDAKSSEARHLAIFAKAAIKQHIANTAEIGAMLSN